MSSRLNSLVGISSDSHNLLNLSDEQSSFSDRHHLSSQTMNIFESMRQRGQLTDVLLRTDDGGKFLAHRAILSGRSPYFRALFTTEFNESKQTEVHFSQIGASCLALILDYAYTKQVEVSVVNVQDLMVAADYFCMDDLLHMCTKFVIDKLDAENCIDIHRFAQWYGFKDLKNRALRFITVNAADMLCKSEEYVCINVEELVCLLKDDYLNVPSEKYVWKAVENWTKFDEKGRLKYLPTLLRCVRLGLLDKDYFVDNIMNNPLVVESPECAELLRQSYTIVVQHEKSLPPLFPEGFSEYKDRNLITPRYPSSVLLAIGGWSVGNPTSVIESYDVRAQKWIRIAHADPKGPRAYHGCVVLGDKIYIFGGFDGMEYFNSMRCFDTKLRKWTEKAPMNCKRCYVSAAYYSGKIYAIGGFDGSVRLNSVECYDPQSNQWLFVEPMNVQRSDAHAAVIDDQIYVCGGFDGRECMSTAERYDIRSNRWMLVQSMLSRRSGIGIVAHKGLVFAVGGFNGTQRLSTAECFNPKLNKWTWIPEMNSPRSNFALDVLDGHIFAVGGFNGSQTIREVEYFDETSRKWIRSPQMTLNRSALYCVTLNNISNLQDYTVPARRFIFEEERKRLSDRTVARTNSSTSGSVLGFGRGRGGLVWHGPVAAIEQGPPPAPPPPPPLMNVDIAENPDFDDNEDAEA